MSASRPAPGAEMIAPSSPVSRPSPAGGLRPALTPTPGGAAVAPVGNGPKEDQQTKIRLTEVSTVWGDCRKYHPEARALLERRRVTGDTKAESIRVLKRRLSDIVYRALLADAEPQAVSNPGTPAAA